MISGLNKFKHHFKDCPDGYVLIGGVACELVLEQLGLEFRPTVDFDIVVVIEVIKEGFGKELKKFIKAGKYQPATRKSGKYTFYKFIEPKNKEYPEILEIASRPPHTDSELPWIGQFAPIDTIDSPNSISAILFEEEYYHFIKRNIILIDGISVLALDALIILKILAWSELRSVKHPSQEIISKATKHLQDIFRLGRAISGNSLAVTAKISSELNKSLDRLSDEEIDIVPLGITEATSKEIIEEIRDHYKC